MRFGPISSSLCRAQVMRKFHRLVEISPKRKPYGWKFRPRKHVRWITFGAVHSFWNLGNFVYNFLKLAAVITVLASLTTGCANRATGSVNPSTDLSALKTMYVRHYPSDNTGVNLEIADKLRSKGVTVMTGNVAPAGHFDAIVTYVDKWRWDITMYLLELTITLRDPKTEMPLAEGNSFHTSLTRMSQTEMVNEVVNHIYGSVSPVATGSGILPAQKSGQAQASSQPAAVPISSRKVEDTLAQKLQELQKLRKDGLVSEAEYTTKRKQLIDKF